MEEYLTCVDTDCVLFFD